MRTKEKLAMRRSLKPGAGHPLETTLLDDWSAIDWANDLICIEAGDHTGRGTLDIGKGASGRGSVVRSTRLALLAAVIAGGSWAGVARAGGINWTDAELPPTNINGHRYTYSTPIYWTGKT